MMVDNNKGKILWILDNPFGIDTPGRRSPTLMDGRQFLEYEFTRHVVSIIVNLLDDHDLSSIQLVPEERDVSMMSRAKRANAFNRLKPCVLVAVHSNAYGEGNRFTVPRGIVSYFQESSRAGEKIARVFQENLIQVTGWRDRGVRRGNFQLFKELHMPAIMTGNGFYTNREQCEYLLDPDWREHIAEAHVEAITEIEKMGPAFFQFCS